MEGQQQIKLDKQVCNELLKNYVNVGYQKAGCFTIGDAANLHRNLNLLTGVEKDDSVSEKQIYQHLLKAIEIANTKGAYDINAGAVIFKLVSFINSDILKETEEPKAGGESSQKIEEL